MTRNNVKDCPWAGIAAKWSDQLIVQHGLKDGRRIYKPVAHLCSAIVFPLFASLDV